MTGDWCWLLETRGRRDDNRSCARPGRWFGPSIRQQHPNTLGAARLVALAADDVAETEFVDASSGGRNFQTMKEVLRGDKSQVQRDSVQVPNLRRSVRPP